MKLVSRTSRTDRRRLAFDAAEPSSGAKRRRCQETGLLRLTASARKVDNQSTAPRQIYGPATSDWVKSRAAGKRHAGICRCTEQL